MTYISLDIGTSGCKGAVIQSCGRIVGTSSREYRLVTPQHGYAELDPREIWQNAQEVLGDLSPLAMDVRGLSISGIGESFVLLDRCDRPLYNFITYLDQRCSAVAEQIRAKIDEERLYAITGLKLNEIYTLGRVLWFRERMPEVYRRAHSLMLFSEYFNFLLTGNRAIDCGTASKTMFFDIEKREWSRELLSLFGIPESLLSPVRDVGAPVGELSPSLCGALNLPRGIMVFLGCHDQIAATLGGGAIHPGDIVIGEGSSESINVVAGRSVLDGKQKNELFSRHICIEPFLTKETYLVPVGLLAFGTSLKWYVSTFEQETIREAQREGVSVYALLDKRCAERTEVLFVPHLSKTSAQGARSHALGAFVGLSLSLDRPELYRAVLEGLHLESRRNLELLSELGLPANSIIVTGGMSSSALAMQIKADIYQAPITRLVSPEAGLIGLSVVCAVALRDFECYEEALKDFVKHKDSFRPKRDYSSKYRRYCAVIKAMRTIQESFGASDSM